MKKIIALSMLATALIYAGPTLTPEVKTLLTEAKANVTSVNDAELSELIKNKKVTLIDVRDADEWVSGHIKADSVVHISRGFLEVKYPMLILKEHKKTDAFVVYCGIEPRAILATARLKELGFTNVKYLEKGFNGWEDNKLPVEK